MALKLGAVLTLAIIFLLLALVSASMVLVQRKIRIWVSKPERFART
jgi:hypothetical protein